jgi:hypothetical protein
MYHTIGNKYEETKGLENSELVKLIKKDLRDQLPKEYKIYAQKEEYAGGWAIHIQLKNTGIDRYDRTSYGSYESSPYRILAKKVQGIVDAYNFNDSDSREDYHHVRFYSHVRVEK